MSRLCSSSCAQFDNTHQKLCHQKVCIVSLTLSHRDAKFLTQQKRPAHVRNQAKFANQIFVRFRTLAAF